MNEEEKEALEEKDSQENQQEQPDAAAEPKASGEETGESELKKEKKSKKDDSLTISKAEAKEILRKFEDANAKCAEANDKYVRMLAEYDNYRRRAVQEKTAAYTDAYADALKEFLPIVDNLERALQYPDADKVVEGVHMTLRTLHETLLKLGIETFGEVGDPFDPGIHNAIAHTESEEFGENVISNVFQKGYRKGDRVLRFAMVQVAN